MEKLKLPAFYLLGANLHPVTNFTVDENTPVFEFYLRAYSAQSSVNELVTTISALRVCRSAAGDFDRLVSEWASWLVSSTSPTQPIASTMAAWDQQMKARAIVQKAKELETLLNAELEILDTYHATQKGVVYQFDWSSKETNSSIDQT